MPGLLTIQQYTSRPVTRRAYNQTAQTTLACAKRRHVNAVHLRPCVQPRKLLPHVCYARETGSVEPAAENFMAAVGKFSPFEDVEPVTLKQLQKQGQEETLPAGFKLAEEGLAPAACYVLLQTCFLRSNGEGDVPCTSRSSPQLECNTHTSIDSAFSD